MDLRAVLLAATILLAGCVGFPDVTPPPREPQSPFELGDQSLRIHAPLLAGDRVVAVHLDAGTAAATCIGLLIAYTGSDLGVAGALVDTAGTTTLWVDFPVAVASAGPYGFGLVARGGLIAANVDPDPFSGERWLWFILPGLVPANDEQSPIGGLRLDLACPGARIVAVWAADRIDAMHWRSKADGAALAFGEGAWAGASDPARIEVPEDGHGILAYIPAGEGAIVGEAPTGPWTHSNRDGFLRKELPAGEHTLRLATEGDSVAIMGAAAPVEDMEAWLAAPPPAGARD